MKKVIIILLIFSLVFTSFFIFKKEEEKTNKNISVILETEEGNIETNTFPSKKDYEYLSTECENTSDNINTIFNESSWKLNLSVEEESIDGDFFCTIYFKEYPTINELIFKNNEIKNTPLTTPGSEVATTDEGLIKGGIDDYNSNMYYFRGKVENNYIKLGEDLWRIVKINGDGSVKIILNDLVLNEDNSVKKIQYSTLETASSISEAQRILKFSNSILLTELKKYYNEKLLDYDEVIEKTKFCTDLSYQMNGTRTDFNTFTRLNKLTAPVSKCSSTSYIYEEKIGSLTSDEIVYAGAAGYITVSTNMKNKIFYLNINDYKSRYFHTISPSVYYMMDNKTISNIVYDFKSGGLVGSNLENNIGIRPVISIKGDTKAMGNGTINDPYVLVF